MSKNVKTRNQKLDHLITPENSVLIIIDYQPKQMAGINSIDIEKLKINVEGVLRTSKLYNLPVVLSTVNDKTEATHTIPEITKILGNTKSIDRTTLNSWEDPEFYEEIQKIGRKKLIMLGLYTEVCLAFPALDALKEGFEVYPVVDAIGGASSVTHDTALRRLESAGAQLITTGQLAAELQRDWGRVETVPEYLEILKLVGEIPK